MSNVTKTSVCCSPMERQVTRLAWSEKTKELVKRTVTEIVYVHDIEKRGDRLWFRGALVNNAKV